SLPAGCQRHSARAMASWTPLLGNAGGPHRATAACVHSSSRGARNFSLRPPPQGSITQGRCHALSVPRLHLPAIRPLAVSMESAPQRAALRERDVRSTRKNAPSSARGRSGGFLRRSGEREADPEGRAALGLVVEAQLAVEELHQRARDGEAEAGAAAV